ncbi:hypothetical protein PC110_g22262 [Phytophthora cactorum]|uniref:Uncharacterized protein n=1 Tax=Phytophthora cactorum TaxID=29920 RepID=A0A329R984_9STRA|nr:hypothetical protein PC110_g22262 [Phytophthora cactorum]
MNIRQRFATDRSIIFYKAVEQHRINHWRSMARHVTDWESEMIENLFEDESSVQAPVPDEAARSMSLDLRRCFRTFISESDTNEWRGVKTFAGTGDLPDDDTCLYVYGWNHNIALRTDQNLITLNKGDFLVYRGDLIYGRDQQGNTAVIEDLLCLVWNCTFTGKGTVAIHRHLNRFHHFRFQRPPQPVTP